MSENEAVRKIRAEQDAERIAAMWEGYEAAVDEGLVEGNESNVNVLPEFYFNKCLIQLTNKERAYMVGREVRLMEMAEARKTSTNERSGI